MDSFGCAIADGAAVSAADAGAERPVMTAQILIDAARAKRVFVVIEFVMEVPRNVDFDGLEKVKRVVSSKA
jgi:hypothetical protein